MSVYDQQLAALQQQYQGYMNQIPKQGISNATITDLRNAIAKQQQMQALTNQYLSAQQAQLQSLDKQKSNDLKTSQENQKLYQENADTSVNLYNQAIAQKNSPFGIYETHSIQTPDSSSPSGYRTEYTRVQNDSGATLSNIGTEISKGIPSTGLDAAQQQIAKSITDPYNLSQSELGIVQASNLGASKLTPQIGQQQNIVQSVLGQLPKESAELGKNKSLLAQDQAKLALQQAQADVANKGQAGGVAATAQQAALGVKAPKGVAAFNSLTATGMPSDNAQQPSQKANMTGQANNPSFLPNMQGLTFGGN